MARRWTLVVMVTLGFAAATRAQDLPVPDAPPTAFSQAPGDTHPPEFCPDAAPGACWTTPFRRWCGLRNAWQEPCDEACPCPCFYVSAGGLAYVRQPLGNGVLVVQDPASQESGTSPGPRAPSALTFGQVTPHMEMGVQAALGFRSGPRALEVSGFYVPRSAVSTFLNDPGRLALPFSAFPAPFGFTGTDSLWLDVDSVSATLDQQMASIEVNYRSQWSHWFEAIVGVRYFDLREDFSVVTDDDSRTAQQRRAPPDPRRVANYSIRTQDHIIGPQFGFEMEKWMVPGLALGLTSKNLVGANFLEVSQTLTRGDGFSGPNGSRYQSQVSAVFELNLHLTWDINFHTRVRGGYSALWLVNVPEAVEQINFNPNVAGGSPNDHGSIFYHGPTVYLQLQW
jgi:hypothetical protein